MASGYTFENSSWKMWKIVPDNSNRYFTSFKKGLLCVRRRNTHTWMWVEILGRRKSRTCIGTSCSYVWRVVRLVTRPTGKPFRVSICVRECVSVNELCVSESETGTWGSYRSTSPYSTLPWTGRSALFREALGCSGKINTICHQETLEPFPREVSNG